VQVRVIPSSVLRNADRKTVFGPTERFSVVDRAESLPVR
jgi:hypothetical protein